MLSAIRNDRKHGSSILLCVSLVIILVLIWYIMHHEYISQCDSRIRHIFDGKLPRTYTTPISPRGDGMTIFEKSKKRLNPEKKIMTNHSAGSELTDKLMINDEPLILGLQVKQKETKEEQFHRSMVDGDIEGAYMEGMIAPIEDFERQYMIQQNNKRKEIYDTPHTLQDRETLSMSNM